jgi:hypothetical protein
VAWKHFYCCWENNQNAIINIYGDMRAQGGSSLCLPNLSRKLFEEVGSVIEGLQDMKIFSERQLYDRANAAKEYQCDFKQMFTYNIYYST